MDTARWRTCTYTVWVVPMIISGASVAIRSDLHSTDGGFSTTSLNTLLK